MKLLLVWLCCHSSARIGSARLGSQRAVGSRRVSVYSGQWHIHSAGLVHETSGLLRTGALLAPLSAGQAGSLSLSASGESGASRTRAGALSMAAEQHWRRQQRRRRRRQTRAPPVRPAGGCPLVSYQSNLRPSQVGRFCAEAASHNQSDFGEQSCRLATFARDFDISISVASKLHWPAHNGRSVCGRAPLWRPADGNQQGSLANNEPGRRS